jgi:hypothetical protein
MAGELFKALMDSQYGADENPYGIGATILGTAAPKLFNPYASAGTNAIYTLGSGLLAGLLGHFAKNQAAEENANLFKSARLFRTAEPEARDALIEENPRLATYGMMYQEQEDAMRQAAAAEKAKRDQDLQYEVLKAQQLAPIELQKELGTKLANAMAENNMLPIGPEGAPVNLSTMGLKSKGEIDAFNVGLKKAEEMRAEADALGYNPKKMDEATSLRKEFNALPEVQNYLNVEKSFNIINKAIQDPSAVSDLELTRHAILLIEPGMAVREGEQAAVMGSQSIPNEWKGKLEKSLKGEAALGPEVREGLRRLALRHFEGNKSQYDRARDFYSQRAKERNIDPGALSRIDQPTVPPGMKLQRNKITGATRIVPQ